MHYRSTSPPRTLAQAYIGSWSVQTTTRSEAFIEIAKGIALLKEAKKNDLRIWIRALENHYADRVLVVDLETSHTWGELTAEAQKAGKIVPASDGLIAATARRHG